MLSKNSSVFLDILRIASAELVVVGHIWFFIDQRTDKALLGFLGQIGVIFFFILSGMLISYSVLKRQKDPQYSFRVFLIDRFARIYSGFIPCLGIIIALNLMHLRINSEHFTFFFGNIESLNVWNFFANLFMLQTLQPIVGVEYTSFGDAAQIWTLGMEWWLYLSFGWYVLRQKSRSSQYDLWFWIPLLLFSAVPFFRTFVIDHGFLVFWYFGVGITLVFLKKPEIISRFLWVLYIVIPAAVLLLMFDILRYHAVAGFDFYQDYALGFFFSILMLFVIFLLNRLPTTAGPLLESGSKLMANYSYTLYLLHLSIVSVVFLLDPRFSTPVVAIFAFFAANIVSLIVALFTEMRYKQLAVYLKRIFI